MNKADGQDNENPGKRGSMTEYFCTKCLQLRLSMSKDKSHCFYCGSTEIIPGGVGELDKQALLAKYRKNGN